MPSRPSVIFTGFRPFLMHATNPSWHVAQAAALSFGADAVATELDVTFDVVAKFAAARAARRFVVGVGLAPRAHVQVETRARNYSGGKPDNDGATPKGLLVPNAPASVPAEVAAGSFFAELTRWCPLRVTRSTDAGDYVCNAYLFHLLSQETHGGPAAAFVHVPALGQRDAGLVGFALGRAARAWCAAPGGR